MTPCFADTFFFLAWWNRRDLAHDRVQEFVGEYTGRLLTTRWVLMEVADAFASSRMQRDVRSLFAEIESDEQITIVEPVESLHRRGLNLYDARPDKEWSLTDCISFVVMADE